VKGNAEPLFGGRQLADWIHDGGRPTRAVGAYGLRRRWHATLFELNWRMQEQRLRKYPLPEHPVFILGLWRSGTSALHELLTAATGWQTPQTWQCFNPSTFLLSGAPAADKSTARPMDAGRIASFGPQEDEFALLLLGAASVYRGFIDPRRLLECARSLEDYSAEPPARWVDFLRGVTAQATKDRLLIKSPSHTFRLPMLRSLFPNARYIWLGRDSAEVVASNHRMWASMTSRYGLWECPSGVVESFLQVVLKATAEVLVRCLDEMPRERLLWIDFTDFRDNPRRTLERIVEFLGPPFEGTDSERATRRELALQRVPVYPGARADALTQQAALRLEGLMAAARHRFGGT
jgi:hypothetical protein